MFPATVPKVAIYGGDTLTLEYRFRDANNDPVDVSAYTFASQWRPYASDTSAIAFTVNQSDDTNGVIILSMTAAQTEAMGADGVFDLRGTQGATVRTFLVGYTSWAASVTRG